MELFNDINNNEHTKQTMKTTLHHYRNRSTCIIRDCIICGSKAIGINFGAPTCAPCKAFFRRNARRKEILDTPCQHPDIQILEGNNVDIDEMIVNYAEIRRCSTCRLRRCFDVGMKQELVRTDEENERHKLLVDTNRKRRDLLKQQQPQDNQLSICQQVMTNNDSINEIDWRHLSNIVYAYDAHCLKNYLEQRTSFFHETSQRKGTIAYNTLLPVNLTFSVSTFLRALPAFQSLSRSNQFYLCKNNLRRLMLVNNHEINQSCFSDTVQAAARKSSWQFICGPDLYKELAYSEQLAEKSWIADPIVTRLWIIVLFFSTSLFSYYDSKPTDLKVKKKPPFVDIQNAYVTLLWKYLLHRHGYMESVRIFSNLIHVYLNMLRVGLYINIRLRTQTDFLAAHETLDQLTRVDINNTQ
ncbi:unnamed protein product [Adineta steineri]|uniref:Nuclear receptor domain-containing protein n=2 Tax=Adineta steineri TaxID=433720 RepID=A0A818P0R9_9BILA|nr:unnamed protein product [Adineta steineri]